MTALICFGLGYSAEHYLGGFGTRFSHIVGTVRSAERAALLSARIGDPLRMFAFDGSLPTAEVETAIAQADVALISIPQTQTGDPVLAAFGDALNAAKRLRSVVYLSTVGVYGDHGGAWVDEETPPQPDMTRSRDRLAAEQAWQDFGARSGVPVAILRLAGIYGPGRNALVQVARGDARRIVKPGQVFNRIHVDDIAQAIDAAAVAESCRHFQCRRRRALPARRSARLRGAVARPRAAAGNLLRGRCADDVADGFEFLAGLPARP